MPPLNTPTFARAVQHALTGLVAVATLVAAGLQIHRNDVILATIDLLIATLLALLLTSGARDHGRVFSNYRFRYPIRRARKPHRCAWCGEAIASGDEMIKHAGAVAGERFVINHHPECAAAVTSWLEQNRTQGSGNRAPALAIGRMQRGETYSRDQVGMRAGAQDKPDR